MAMTVREAMRGRSDREARSSYGGLMVRTPSGQESAERLVGTTPRSQSGALSDWARAEQSRDDRGTSRVRGIREGTDGPSGAEQPEWC